MTNYCPPRKRFEERGGHVIGLLTVTSLRLMSMLLVTVKLVFEIKL